MPVKAQRKAPRGRKGAPAVTRTRRGIGRPPAGAQTVGREALIAKTCELLREIPPNQLTRAEVARRLQVDPSLIRYYFSNRGTLLLAALEQLTSEFTHMFEQEMAKADGSAEGLLRARVAAMLRFEITYPFFHRLLLEEIVPLDSQAAVRFLDTLTKRAVSSYASIVKAGVDEGTFQPLDHAFLFLTVVGMCEFFVNGLPILRIAQGKDLDEHVPGARYLEFVCKLLLDGLRVRSR